MTDTRPARPAIGQSSAHVGESMRPSPIVDKEQFSKSHAGEIQNIANIDPSDCEPWPLHDRILSDEPDEEFVASIRKHGQKIPGLATPIPNRPGKFWIIYGLRRWNGCQLSGRNFRAVVANKTDEEFLIEVIIENQGRKDISAIERALQIWKVQSTAKTGMQSRLEEVGISRSQFFKYIEIAEIQNHKLLFDALRNSVNLIRFNEALQLGQKLKALVKDRGDSKFAEIVALKKEEFQGFIDSQAKEIADLKARELPEERELAKEKIDEARIKIDDARKKFVSKVIQFYWMIMTDGKPTESPNNSPASAQSKIDVSFSRRQAVASKTSKEYVFKVPREKKLTKKMINEAVGRFKEFLEENATTED